MYIIIYIYTHILCMYTVYSSDKMIIQFSHHSRIGCLRRLCFFTSLYLGPVSELRRIYSRNRQARQQQYIARKKADKEEAVQRTLS